MRNITLIHDFVLCKACGFELTKTEINNYSICLSCGSVNYISERSAEEDNIDYFNSVYSNKSIHTIEKRRILFSKFARYHSLFHHKETKKFHLFLQKISEMIINNSSKTIEFGFGHGDELIRYLKAGADIFGLDISNEAVHNFKSKYPEYSMRVLCGTNCDFSADIIYANALFEHLDNPNQFLINAFSMLNSGGHLIMRLPLLNLKNVSNQDTYLDISFWKPCHRVIYSLQGLTVLLKKFGFEIIESAALRYYGYIVMNYMLQRGYKDIEYIRNPYYKIRDLNSDWIYRMILLRSLFGRTICSDFAFIAKKI